jgi:hypothetical protein
MILFVDAPCGRHESYQDRIGSAKRLEAAEIFLGNVATQRGVDDGLHLSRVASVQLHRLGIAQGGAERKYNLTLFAFSLDGLGEYE